MKRSFGAWACMAALGAFGAHTEIAERRVLSVKPYGQFATGKYVQMEAEARGELDASEPMPGLDKAGRNHPPFGCAGSRIPAHQTACARGATPPPAAR